MNSHNAEVDDEERRVLEERRISEEGGNKEENIRRVVDRAECTIKLNSKVLRWKNGEIIKNKVPNLKPSYVIIREEDMKWMRIDYIHCSGSINFVSKEIRNNVPTAKDDQVEYVKEPKWVHRM